MGNILPHPASRDVGENTEFCLFPLQSSLRMNLEDNLLLKRRRISANKIAMHSSPCLHLGILNQ